MNKYIALGNLTRDPELKNVKNDNKVCSFSIAINNKLNDTTFYVDVETWNKTAENCSRFLSKGRKVLIEGRLQLNTWQSKTGENRSKVYCVADMVTFLDKSTEPKKDSVAEQVASKIMEEEDDFADIPF